MPGRTDLIGDFGVVLGGLMRCCLATLDEQSNCELPPSKVLKCKYCTQSLVLTDENVWQWNAPPPPPEEAEGKEAESA